MNLLKNNIKIQQLVDFFCIWGSENLKEKCYGSSWCQVN